MTSHSFTTLITGAGGMLGSDLSAHFKAQCGEDKVWALSHEDLDITQSEAVEATLLELRPDVIINAAAYTDVDKAEKEKELAYRLNATGPELLRKVSQSIGAKLVHFSTDQVFDGLKNIPWTEKDTPRPLNTYAQTKWEGEKAVLSDPDALVLRVQWLFGKKKNRFIPLKEKKTFTPAQDQWGAPTWTRHIAQTVYRLLQVDACGLYHYSYDDYSNWMEVFQFVKDKMCFSTELIPKDTKDLNLPAQRPLFCVLSNKKLLNTLGVSALGSWKSALQEFLDYERKH